MAKQLNLLLLCTGSASSHLIKAIEAKGHTYEVYNPMDLYLFVSESEDGYDRIYDGSDTLSQPVRLPSKRFDGVVSRIGANLAHGASILRHLTDNLGIFCAQDADGLETASNKLKTTQRLSARGLKVPLTVYAHKPVHTDFIFKKVGGLPAVAKLLQGSQGEGVFILESALSANTALQAFSKVDVSLKFQKFVDAGGKDIRAIVVGDKVSVAMERTANKGDFRANISRQGSGKKVELSDSDTELCIKAAKAVNLDFAGVDIMKDQDGTSYVVEVNGNPGTKIIDITGHNYFNDLITYIEENQGKSRHAKNEGSAKNSVIQGIKSLLRSSDNEYAHLGLTRTKNGLYLDENGHALSKADVEARQSWFDSNR